MTFTFSAGDTSSASILREAFPAAGALISDGVTASALPPPGGLLDVPGLGVAVEPSTDYAIDGYIAYDTGVTPGVSFSLEAPEGTTGHWGVSRFQSVTSGMSPVRKIDFEIGSFENAPGSASIVFWLQVHGFASIGPAGGMIRMRFTQTTSDASLTVVRAGSWLRATQL